MADDYDDYKVGPAGHRCTPGSAEQGIKLGGRIVSPHQAEAIIAVGQADFVAVARGFLDDLRWG
jgi:2,4-dienoyl-CoA reductase-like NADH-dependent reductase (Old Yellow Enzyme family)